MRLTRRWQTIAVVGYDGAVSRHQDTRAHGGVCLLQARTGSRGALGRKVNTQGRYFEVGDSFGLTTDVLDRWRSIRGGR